MNNKSASAIAASNAALAANREKMLADQQNPKGLAEWDKITERFNKQNSVSKNKEKKKRDG